MNSFCLKSLFCGSDIYLENICYIFSNMLRYTLFIRIFLIRITRLKLLKNYEYSKNPRGSFHLGKKSVFPQKCRVLYQKIIHNDTLHHKMHSIFEFITMLFTLALNFTLS